MLSFAAESDITAAATTRIYSLLLTAFTILPAFPSPIKLFRTRLFNIARDRHAGKTANDARPKRKFRLLWLGGVSAILQQLECWRGFTYQT
ncbi:MAG: hypothetical protein AMJ46_13245 [Latescibacteria bacterium DG_63]|nr:MAG: hypothetical protein AMJ46_13245 [Latescibacteria bacterium DG_63]